LEETVRDHTKLRAFELADELVMRELHYQFGVARRLGYLDKPDFSECNLKMVEAEKVLSALLRSLRNT
jgi:hypothetical protein